MMKSFTSITNVFFILLLSCMSSTHAKHGWEAAHATFYGGPGGGEAEQAACGYTASKQGYGFTTAALSTILFNDGRTCGACYRIRCKGLTFWGEDACLKGNPSVTITATNFCPPADKPNDAGGWCNPPLKHFDMTEYAFKKIAVYKAGIVPVQYKRVPCIKQGNVGFSINGNKWFNLVLVYNVGGVGDVIAMSIKGTKTGWLPMRRNWGQNWQCNTILVNQALSFKVTTSDSQTITAYNVVPQNWQFGQSFDSHVQFV